MLRLIFLLVASLVRTSFKIDIVEMLSDLKMASPFLERKKQIKGFCSTDLNFKDLSCLHVGCGYM